MKIKLLFVVLIGVACLAVGFAIAKLTHKPEAKVTVKADTPETKSALQAMAEKAMNEIK